MIEVKTYLKVGDVFIPASDFNGQVPDPQYIEGAIKLNINGVDVLTLELWDYVDQLWSYIAQGLIEVSETGSWKTYFPDQPVELMFRTDEQRKRIIVEASPSEGRVVASASYDEFMTEMSNEGQRFFRKMIEIVPENRATDEKQLARLATVLPKAAHR